MSVFATIWVWFKRLLKTVALLLVAVIVGAIGCEQINRFSAASEFPPPGRMVSVDGYDMHLNCTGDGSPVALLESGLTGLGSMQWAVLQPAVPEVTTVCAYDRAGIALSTNSDQRLVTGTGHFIHLDDPEAAVQAIRDVVRAARNGTSVTPAPAAR